MAGSALVVPVAELLRRPGAQRNVRVEVAAEGLSARDAHVPDGADVAVDVVLESLSDGITVDGEVRTTWEGTCRRCLGPARGELRAEVHELYQHDPMDEDAFRFEGDQLDLHPMVRELVMVELPMAPICRDDCRGLCPVCGADRNEADRTGTDCGHGDTPADARWAALDALRSPRGERLPDSS
jgi:uncharacterized protein